MLTKYILFHYSKWYKNSASRNLNTPLFKYWWCRDYCRLFCQSVNGKTFILWSSNEVLVRRPIPYSGHIEKRLSEDYHVFRVIFSIWFLKSARSVSTEHSCRLRESWARSKMFMCCKLKERSSLLGIQYSTVPFATALEMELYSIIRT